MGCTTSSVDTSASEIRFAARGSDRKADRVNALRGLEEDAPISPPENLGVVGNCLICLPEACVRVLGIAPNINDKGETDKRFWLGRAWQLRALSLRRYRAQVLSKQKPLTAQEKKAIDEALQDPAKRALALKIQKMWRGAVERHTASLSSVLTPLGYHPTAFHGTVLFMHGSGGMTYNNVRYARKLASLGYIVIAPDSMAGGDFRHRDLASLIKPEQETPYWDDLGLYASDAEGQLVYNTKAEAVVHDADKWRTLYENVFRLRSAEMHWILSRLPKRIRVQGVFTMGQSEGAMAVARFDDRRYGAMIQGRIISAFSVEYCYFTPTREAATYGGSAEVPTLNIIGDADQFFGPIDSVALSVCKEKGHGGWGADNFTGNGFKEMKRQKLRRGLVCVLEGAKHDASETHDNFLRDLLRAFLTSPSNCHQIPERWEPDAYLHSAIKVLERDTEDHGVRVLLKVGQMPISPQTHYGTELLLREAPRQRRDVIATELSKTLLHSSRAELAKAERQC
mmetsp:Transcript_137047/g.356021  ORF Transcript_137047/g.356021 Transcript_137047/m.356021 type:complete len:510 (+) Transcript_137047:90-1619(+)